MRCGLKPDQLVWTTDADGHRHADITPNGNFDGFFPTLKCMMDWASKSGIRVGFISEPPPAADDERWEQLKDRIESAPVDVATFIERRTGCNHFDGEVGSEYPERERMIQDERKKLRCDEIGADERALRKEHRRSPEVLLLLDDTKHLLPW